MFRLVCLITGMLFGSLPSGYIIARAKGVDLRKHGSGNIGTTNVLRTLGKGAGALTLVFDMGKAFVPLFITAFIYGANTDIRYLVTLYTGLGAVLGHDFSPWMNFKGGKGIASSGAMVMFIDPMLFLMLLAGVAIPAALTGYMSVGSLLAAVMFVIGNFIMYIKGSFGWSVYPYTFVPGHTLEAFILVFAIAILAITRHKANIIRLMNGNENKIFSKK